MTDEIFELVLKALNVELSEANRRDFALKAKDEGFNKALKNFAAVPIENLTAVLLDLYRKQLLEVEQKIDAKDFLKSAARKFELLYADLDTADIDYRLCDKTAAQTLKNHEAMPFSEDENFIYAVFKNPFDILAQDKLQNAFQDKILKVEVCDPAMRLADRVDGHLLQGHIDAIGEVARIERRENGVDFYINLPPSVMPLMANKGSIAVEGVSLTINEVLPAGVRLTIIPITFRESLFGEFEPGRRVNVESDLLARYVARQLEFGRGAQNGGKGEISWDESQHIASLY